MATQINKVWLNENAKWKACLQLFAAKPNTIFIGWFDDSVNKLKQCFEVREQANITVLLSRELRMQQAENSDIVFIEHHPSCNREQQLFEKIQLSRVLVYCSLDEAFFQYFGGEKIKSLAQTLGLREEDCIEHKMITLAISNAQKKIENNMLVEQSARSQKEWMDRNAKPH